MIGKIIFILSLAFYCFSCGRLTLSCGTCQKPQQNCLSNICYKFIGNGLNYEYCGKITACQKPFVTYTYEVSQCSLDYEDRICTSERCLLLKQTITSFENLSPSCPTNSTTIAAKCSTCANCNNFCLMLTETFYNNGSTVYSSQCIERQVDCLTQTVTINKIYAQCPSSVVGSNRCCFFSQYTLNSRGICSSTWDQNNTQLATWFKTAYDQRILMGVLMVGMMLMISV